MSMRGMNVRKPYLREWRCVDEDKFEGGMREPKQSSWSDRHVTGTSTRMTWNCGENEKELTKEGNKWK